MPTPPVAPAAPVTPEPGTEAPKDPKDPAGAPAADAKGTLPVKPAADAVPEFKPLEVVVDGKKLVINTQAQLTAALQKALYADQEIKNARQAIEGVKSLKEKLKSKEGLREVLSDPEIGVDVKKLAIEFVREAMDEEKLTPAEREARDLKKENEAFKKKESDATAAAELEKRKKEVQEKATAFRVEIIDAMKAHPDIPQDQETMDACIQIMRAAYRRFQKVLPAAKAMEIVEKRYFDRLATSVKAWPAEKIIERFGKEVLDRMQQVELDKLRNKNKPGSNGKPPAPSTPPTGKKKGHLTEAEWSKLVDQRIAGL